MSFRHKLLAYFLSLLGLVLAACKAPAYRGGAALEPSADPAALRWCGRIQGTWIKAATAAEQAKWLVHLSPLAVRPADSAAQAKDLGCDVFMSLNVPAQFADSWQVAAEVVSARTGHALLLSQGNSGVMGGMGGNLAQSMAQLKVKLHEAFRVEGPLHRQVMLERAPAAAPAAGSAPAAALKAEDVAKIVEALESKKAAPARAGKDPSSDADEPRYSYPPNPDNFAVVAGVEKYSGDLPEARFAERDAKAVARHLEALGWPRRNILLLTGAQASRAGLVKNLETRLPGMVNERSTVFFYYSGHGAPDPKSGESYLVPADGDPEFLSDTAYPVKRLYERLGSLKARRVFAAIDSCFSGRGERSILAKGTRPLVSRVDPGFPSAGKVVALTASAGEEISGSLEEQGHGAFTYFLLRGLNGAAKDQEGAVTVKSLYEYVLPNVQDEARRANRGQTPQLLPANLDKGADLRFR